MVNRGDGDLPLTERSMLLATKKIVAVLDDLFFTVKILDAARRAGLEAVFVQDEAQALELARELPPLIILDLNAHSVDAIRIIQTLKNQAETRRINLIGFVPHVQIDLRQRAQTAGANLVVPRSTFSTNLPDILRQYAQAEGPVRSTEAE